MKNRGAFVVTAVAMVLGLGIGYVDSRPGWDDTGVTAGALLFVAAVLSVVRPANFLAIGLATGLPVLATNAVLHGNYGSAIAVVISLAGAAIGRMAGSFLGIGSGGSRR